VCLPVGCGNARLDPGEACDDGNTSAGDGCSADCKSNETCGNGTLDLGEMCDDGNLLTHDGCDSRCRDELPRWRLATPHGIPVQTWAASAYDEQRHRLVVFGGYDDMGTALGTREWDGNAWLYPAPVLEPSVPRILTAMAYDPIRHQTVLFGGNDLAEELADTWVWDGDTWSEVTTVNPPPARDDHKLAWDGTRHQIIMFGGYSQSGTALGDTWAWDGARWTQLSPATSPPAHSGAVMAFDPKRNLIVLAGGGGYADTWTWDGATWTVDPAVLPEPRVEAAMAYSPTIDAMVLTGGGSGPPDESYVYTWQPGSWTEHQPQPASTAGTRLLQLSWFDPTLGRVVIAGGGDINAVKSDMWSWDGMTFQKVTASVAPAVDAPALCADRARGKLVLAGLSTTGTWEHDGSSWALRSSKNPVPTGSGPIAYDSARGVCVLYVSTGDIWEYQGATGDWTQIVAPPGPMPRVGTALAYDEQRQRILMFGGQAMPNGFTNELWAWDGTSWSHLPAGATTPGARANAGFAYDRAAHHIVLFGGSNDPFPPFADTWIWDGTWTNVTPTTTLSPSARFDSALSYDERLHRMVLYGGTGSTFDPLSDLWTWDGASWTRLHTEPGLTPGNAFASTLTYDPVTASSVLMKASGEYRLRWDSGSRDDLCDLSIDLDGDGLTGCADPDCGLQCASCGDGTCGALESCTACPADCSCVSRCGDDRCDPGETAVCLGDC
jgi:cysteine-rich repeat protein